MDPLAWVAALVAAAFPTWDLWRQRFEWERVHFGAIAQYVCPFRAPSDPLLPLRADVEAVVGLSTEFGIPALVILAAFAARRSAAAGRRAAAALALLGVAIPLSGDYSGRCGEVAVLSSDWFEVMSRSWGGGDLALLTASALVALATPVAGQAV
ncbi:MAG: hypothetical protein HOQ38_01925, partial [Nonomuraea sp.]|nr:hypothetical protein [Nonomuraea sp.]